MKEKNTNTRYKGEERSQRNNVTEADLRGGKAGGAAFLHLLLLAEEEESPEVLVAPACASAHLLILTCSAKS